ncbi:unnamed protein product [Phaeothamnion confervicola]
MQKLLLFLLLLLSLTPGLSARPKYAIVVHGGAGADPAKLSKEEMAAYENGMRRVLKHATARLEGGAEGLDVVEEVLKMLEDDPWFNAGRGGALNEDGQAELDASIMNGANLRCGAVASVRRVKNPISLARKVMENTKHVLIVGEGADRFGKECGLEIVDPSYFITERTRQALEGLRKKSRGTTGCVVLDSHGNLTAGTSTGGLTGKKVGRVGDSPIIGAGCYADNRSCAISCTGTGEEFIRQEVAFQIHMRMRLKGETIQDAAETVFRENLPDDVGGVIGLDREGHILMHFNTAGMTRGAADATGRFEIGIGPGTKNER